MDIAYVISLILLVIASIIKGTLHVYLDYRNHHKISFARSKGYVYFLPYDNDVCDQDEFTKTVCNRFQKLTIIFLILFIVIAILRYVLSH